MSQPPKYQSNFKFADEEASVGLLATEEAHVYPPSASAAATSPGAPKSVVYHLRPSFPVSKVLKEQDAVSIIGRDRAETVNLVLSAFPELKRYDEDRLNFLVPSDPLTGLTQLSKFARITDPAWPGLQASVIRVELADLPGDDEARKWHERRRIALILGMCFGLPTLVMGVLILVAVMSSD